MGVNAKTVEEQHRLKHLKELRKELQEKISENLPEAGVQEIQVKVEKLDEALAVDQETAKRVIEALLFSTSKPLTAVDLKRVLKGYQASKIQKIVAELQEEYVKDERSFRLVEIAGGYEISTEQKYAPWLMKLELQKKARQATASALETLAIMAYKQPVTRAEIEDLRGVNSSGMIAALLEKSFIRIVGRKEVPGRPMLYGTTDKFLEHFGLKSLKELPNISEIRDLVENSIRKEELIQPKETIVSDDEVDAIVAEEDAPLGEAVETPAEAAAPEEEVTPEEEVEEAVEVETSQEEESETENKDDNEE